MVGYVGDTVSGPTDYAAGSPELFNELVDKANAASEDDDQLNWSELETFLESLVGGDITREQAEKLIKIYGGNGVVGTNTIVEVMTRDGFLSPIAGDGSFVMGWHIDWDAIDGGLISDALYREMGLDPAVDRMTAAQFDEATDKLFGDREGVTSDNAVFLARSFGTGELLDRTQIAGIFDRDDLHIDGVAGEGYIRLFANYSDTTKAFTTNDEAADYIMKFDANGDGFLTREELQTAINSRLADGAGTDDDIMNQFMMYYGEKHPLGEMIVTRDGVMAMLNDTSLNLSTRGGDGANGFGINLHITPVDRVINGYSYFNPDSFNDGIVSKDELEAMFARLGLTLTPEQAQFLINVYGNGTTMLVSDVTRMRDDGFMTTGTIMIDPVTLDWNAIDGVLLARAVFWAAGVDPNTPGATLTPEQFNAAVDKLFGDSKGQSLDDAKKQVKFFGANNVVTVDQMAAVFDNPGFYMTGEKGANNVKIEIKLGDVEMTTVQQQTAYLMSFDEDGNGVLSEKELYNAIASDKNDQHTTLNDDMITRLARIYAMKQADGSYAFDPAILDQMADDGVLAALPNSSGNPQRQGLSINLAVIPDERIIDAMFRWAGKNPELDTLTAQEFDEGTDHVLGDWKPIRGDSRNLIAATFGTTGVVDENGVSTMSRDDIVNVFNSGAVQRGEVGDRTFLPIVFDITKTREWVPLPDRSNPEDTFATTPSQGGFYYTTQRYEDGTVIRMQYETVSFGNKGNRKYVVKSIDISTPNTQNPGSPYVTTIAYDRRTDTYSVVSQSEGVGVSLSNWTDAVVISGPGMLDLKRFSLSSTGPATYNLHSPIVPFTTVEDPRYQIRNDPTNDVVAVSSQYTGSTTTIGMNGRTTADTFAVTMSDGSVVNVQVHYSVFTTRARNQQMAEQFANKFGKLPPNLQAFLRTHTLAVEYNDLVMPKTYGGYFYMGYQYMVIPQSTVNASDEFFQSVVLHELGHAVDTDIPTDYWLNAMTADKISVTGYATTQPTEDFAETYFVWYMVRTGQFDPATAAEMERKFANRFYLLDRSQTARATLPPENLPQVDRVQFNPFTGRS